MAAEDYVPSQNEMAGILAATVAGTGIFTVISFASGLNITPRAVFLVMVAFLGFSFITRQSGDYTAGFILLTIGLLMILADYVLPRAVVGPFEFFIDFLTDLTGMNFGSVPSWQFFVVSVVGVAIVIGSRVRYSGDAKYIDKILDRVLREFRKYVDNYVTFARLFAVFTFSVLVVVLEQSGAFLGAVGDRIAEVPFIAANFVTALAGYASLGGVIVIPNPFQGGPVIIKDAPLIGTLDALDFLVFSALVIGIAAASKYTGRGPLARIL